MEVLRSRAAGVRIWLVALLSACVWVCVGPHSARAGRRRVTVERMEKVEGDLAALRRLVSRMNAALSVRLDSISSRLSSVEQRVAAIERMLPPSLEQMRRAQERLRKDYDALRASVASLERFRASSSGKVESLSAGIERLEQRLASLEKDGSMRAKALTELGKRFDERTAAMSELFGGELDRLKKAVLRLGKSLESITRSFPTTYVVRKGDTLYTIARKYGIRLKSLIEANPGLGGKVRALRPGRRIVIPPRMRSDKGAGKAGS